MSKFNNIWYVEAMILVPVTVQIAANDEQEAFSRLMDGAWHNVDPKQYNGAVVKSVGTFTKGPSINGLGRK